MEGKSNFFILLCIVAFLSLAVVGLTVYVFIAQNNAPDAVQTTKAEATKAVDEKELSAIQLFDGKKYLNLKSTDDKRLPAIQIGISVKYLKGKNEEESKKKMEGYTDQMREAVIAYFSNMTIEEAKNQSVAMEKARKDLLKKFNEIVPHEEKDKKSVVNTVIFYDWFTQ